ncbi:Ppx/GppA phosphatase family protein [Aurantivibrio plasticivorans]
MSKDILGEGEAGILAVLDSIPTYVALDLGSNSFHMLVARYLSGKLEVIDRHREGIRLAEGLRKDGTLAKKTINEALMALERFAERIRSIPNRHVRVVGTNTLRAARNADIFLEKAELILQCPIDIITGIEEARLVYFGVANDFDPDAKRRLVIDIGGGSTELICGDTQPNTMESLHMGCVSYTQRFFPEGKFNKKSYRKAKIAAQAEVQAVANAFLDNPWQEAVGASGTIKAVEAVLEAMGCADSHAITREGLDQLVERLMQFTTIDEFSVPGLNEERKKVFAGGLAVLDGVFTELGMQELHVSNYAIREGVILDMVGLDHERDVRSDTVRFLQQQYRVDQKHAERVKHFAFLLLEQTATDFDEEYIHLKKLLGWAIDLHEIGISIAHSSYHKHSAYLLLHSNMAGFSKQEQKMLSFIVLNHRRKLRTMEQTYGFEPDWRLVQIVRLACLFNRRREDIDTNGIAIRFSSEGAKLALPKDWLERNPLTKAALRDEQAYQSAQSNNLELVKSVAR